VTIPAAIANAVFDATGVRIRRLPLDAERVKAALTASA
jgi:CO/xanthine dehydrogenase Mo-binding subunit